MTDKTDKIEKQKPQSDDEEPVKKRPGRPRKTQPQQPKPKLGIVQTPIDADHFMEFLYDQPSIFKKLWAFFKSMAVGHMHMAFTKSSINIYCVDHNKKSQIRVKIDCTKVNHYFCKEDLDIGLACDNLKLIMNTIDKSCNSILLLSTHDNIQRNIQIVLKNEIDIEESHKIELVGEYEKNLDDAKFLDDDYMIKFKLTGKYFKKMIADIRSFSDQVTIRKDGPDDNLIFEYTKDDKKVKSEYIIKNSSTISLRDNLGEDDTFRTSFKIDYVKPISASLLNETIEIYSDENKPLKFVINMDSAVEIIILTSIVDMRD